MRSDAELVDAFREGEGDAFGELYDRYADRIQTFAQARLRDEADATEAVHDTFVRVNRRLVQLREPDRFHISSTGCTVRRTSIPDG